MCEDFPCCGHEQGCCPDYVDGCQVNMRCTCGAVLPVTARSSICDGCYRHMTLQDEGMSDQYYDYLESLEGE